MRPVLARCCPLLVTVVLLLSVFSPAAAAVGGPGNGYLPGEVVVKLAQASDLPGVAATYALDPTPVDQFGSRPIFRRSSGTSSRCVYAR